MVTKTVSKPAVKKASKPAAKSQIRVTAKQVAVHRENAKRDLSPKWDGSAELDSAMFLRLFHEAMKWYRLESSVKELKPKVIDWMGRNGSTKKQIDAYKKTKDWRTDLTTGAIAASLLKGMPRVHTGLNNGKDTAQWLYEQIAKIVEAGKYDIEVVAASTKAVKVVAVPNIQERMKDAAALMTEEIDVAIDSYIEDPDAFDPKAFKVVSLLRGKGAKAAHARFIKGFFERPLAEYTELISKTCDPQLAEGYSNYSKKNIRKMFDFLTSIFEACEQIAAEAKVMKKPRAKKVKPAEELVKKIKFKMSDDRYAITSVPAAQIIGAQSVVVFNTKTRKLGIYIAKTSEGLQVKGASIDNFTEKSVQKTLRKPETQMKEFKELNTSRRMQTWFDAIKTTDTVMNGRINAEVMILKAWK
jgi:hypothetical protein